MWVTQLSREHIFGPENCEVADVGRVELITVHADQQANWRLLGVFGRPL
jgi:hypothetical protein